MKPNRMIALIVSATIYIGGVAWGAAEAPTASDSPLGRAVQTCGTCHGTNGRSVSPTFPNLAAQTAPYIEAQLKAFKDQTRADPDAQAYMWGMAAQLSDSQITPCASCHGAHGEGMATFPRLAGQHAPYLLKQILVIQNALRNAPVMHGIVKDLSRDQILAVTAYLESI
jgi:cytochrome c553